MLFPLRLDIAALPDNSPPLISRTVMNTHLRVDYGDDDVLLDLYVRAAISWCENALHRTVFERSHRWVLRDFELCYPQAIRLPRGKTQSVERIEYSSGGEAVTLYGPTGDASPAGADYQEDLRGDDGGVLMPVRGGSWPSVDRDVPAPVVVQFTAGYAADAVPPDLLHGILFTIADCYDIRGTGDFNPALLNGGGPRFEARWALVSPYLLSRWY